MVLEILHNALRDRLSERTSLATVLLYPAGRARVDVPAGLLELSEMEMGANPGTEELALNLTWALRILVDVGRPNAAMTLQALMIEAAQALYLSPFETMSTPTDFSFAYETPQDGDAFVIGRMTWVQETHFGESVWADGGPLPKTVHVTFTNQGVRTC